MAWLNWFRNWFGTSLEAVTNRESFCAVEEMCVCVCVSRERERVRAQDYRKSENIVLRRSKNDQQLQREGEGAYVVTFSLSSLTSTASWERGEDLTT